MGFIIEIQKLKNNLLIPQCVVSKKLHTCKLAKFIGKKPIVQKTLQSNTTCGNMDHQHLQMDEFLSSELWMSPKFGIRIYIYIIKLV
jgi:hypothetical protein